MARRARCSTRAALLAALLGACGSRPPALVEQQGPTLTRILLTSGTQVLEYDLATGGFRRVFASGFSFAAGATLGTDGNLYVVDLLARTVVRLNGQTGANLGVFATLSCDAEPLAFGTAGDLFVACTFGPVMRFHGTTGAALGAFVPAPGAGETAGGLTFHDGSLFVSWLASGPGKLIRYDAATGAVQGTVYDAFGSNGPRRPVFGPDGAMYVPDWQSPTVKKFAASTLALVGNVVNDAAAVPSNVAFTSDGYMLVLSDPCCDGPDTVRRYDLAGGFLGTVVAAGAGGLGRAHTMVLAP